MKKNLFISLLIFTLFSCNHKISKESIAKINGYWEIEKVVLADGTKKEYKINETIDFFEIKKNIGFRKKVTPQFDGKYLVNNAFENIKILTIDNKTFVQYKTNYENWKEQIIEVSDEKLILENDSSVVYHYKKPILFSVK